MAHSLICPIGERGAFQWLVSSAVLLNFVQNVNSQYTAYCSLSGVSCKLGSGTSETNKPYCFSLSWAVYKLVFFSCYCFIKEPPLEKSQGCMFALCSYEIFRKGLALAFHRQQTQQWDSSGKECTVSKGSCHGRRVL